MISESAHTTYTGTAKHNIKKNIIKNNSGTVKIKISSKELHLGNFPLVSISEKYAMLLFPVDTITYTGTT
jgi:hypothetical protein